MSAADPGPAGEAMFLLVYETRPTEALADADGIGGAFVSCWVRGPGLGEARDRAKRHLEASGWAILSTLGEAAVDDGAVPEDARPYYDQARAEGEVYVIQAFPPEPADA